MPFMHHTWALLRLRFIHYNTIVWVKLTHLEQKTFVHKSWVKPFKTKIMVQLSKAIWFKPRHFKDNFSKILINYNYNYCSSTMVPLSLTYMPSRNFRISLFFTWHFCKTNKRLGQQVQITYNWNDCTFFLYVFGQRNGPGLSRQQNERPVRCHSHPVQAHPWPSQIGE